MLFKKVALATGCTFALIAGSAQAASPSNADVMEALKALQMKVEKLEKENQVLKAQGKPAGRYNDYSHLSPKNNDTKVSGKIGISYLRPSSNTFQYFQTDDGNDDMYQDTEQYHGFEPGYEAELNIPLEDSRWSLGVSGKYYANEMERHQFIGQTNAWRMGKNKEEVTNTALSADFRRILLDTDATYTLINEADGKFSFITGLRAGHMAGSVAYENITGTDRVNSKFGYTGLGPKIGMDANFAITDQLGFKTSVSGSVLVGRKDNQVTTNGDGDAKSSGFHAVPVFDTEVAGHYKIKTKDMDLVAEFGLQAEYWANAPSHYIATDDTTGAEQSHEDYLMFGPFARLKATF
ncbi:exported hypothetical protein [Candidatus Terasakiella magnetica]|uniref:Uncharacterized protein n=1 Tax=Candidatus Terasakiella magnetica TaxID=1867952 RepID=A0A1C3RKM6_9PROT|nr:Lpg1974 family pore-forming outer membrane protein [Candidatus Terasakiella magnetica]SCA57803.1 exported hypothetical protein [Candidatus Terasakiella magnetica]